MTSGPLLIVAARDFVIAYRRDNGHEVWRFKYQTQYLGSPASYDGPVELAIHGTRVYAAIQKSIVCLDYTSGAVVGTVQLPTTSERSTFIIEGDHMYLAASDHVMCFTLDGKTLWQTPHGMQLTSGAAIGVPGNVRQGDDIGRE